ncbi:MAG: insulinase family protein [Clostridia bacterium]|nr:insulinase family protein [Clostridia bacterium]
MTRINIADGINLNIIHSDKFKTNELKINFTLPLKKEIAPLASLLPAVLRRGCEKYPTMLLFNRQLENLYATGLGGTSAKLGEKEVITFTASFLRNEFIPDKTDLLSLVCELMTDFVFRPLLEDGKLCASYVEGEKKNLIDRIEAEINNKGAYANKRLFEIMCEDEAYSVSHLGTPEDVSAITAESLTEFYRTEFAKAPVEIFFVGVCNEDEFTAKIRQSFTPFARKAEPYTEDTVKETVQKLRRVTEEMPVNQGKLSMGFRTGACTAKKNNPQFLVFNEIFGGSPTSKLFENVREKLSLCYYCSSRYVSTKGIMYIASGVKVGDETAAEEEILRQLDAMKNGEFSENDIEVAKLSLENGYKSCYDDADKLAFWYFARIIAGEENASIEDVIEKINKVTKEEIIAIASTVIPDTVYFLKGTNLDETEEADEE